MPARWLPRSKGRARRDWSFVEFIAVLFGLGLVVELVYLTESGANSWLWILPGLAALIGIMLLVAREPANL